MFLSSTRAARSPRRSFLAPECQRRRHGATRREPARSPGGRRTCHLLLALLVLGASALAPALGGDPIDDRFGVAAASARGEPSRSSILRGEVAGASGHPAWATSDDHHAASESLRTARRTGPSTLLRFASLGAAPLAAPRARDLTRLASPEEARVDALIHSLGSAPRGPPAA